jgi:hypothetical protein
VENPRKDLGNVWQGKKNALKCIVLCYTIPIKIIVFGGNYSTKITFTHIQIRLKSRVTRSKVIG